MFHIHTGAYNVLCFSQKQTSQCLDQYSSDSRGKTLEIITVKYFKHKLTYFEVIFLVGNLAAHSIPYRVQRVRFAL